MPRDGPSKRRPISSKSLDGGTISRTVFDVRNNAVANITNSTAEGDGAWIDKVKNMSPNDPGYVKAFGSAVHQEMNALIESEQAAGNLPKDMVTNNGVSQPDYNLPNNYKPKDSRYPPFVG